MKHVYCYSLCVFYQKTRNSYTIKYNPRIIVPMRKLMSCSPYFQKLYEIFMICWWAIESHFSSSRVRAAKVTKNFMNVNVKFLMLHENIEKNINRYETMTFWLENSVELFFQSSTGFSFEWIEKRNLWFIL